jgi:uncharacterized protein YkwD
MFTFVYLLALLPSTAFAGPACAHRNWKNANCIAKCSAKWGFPGSVMGTDPWGAVMKPSDADMSAIMSEACGMPANDQSDPSSLQPAESQTLIFPTSYMAYPSPQVASPSSSSEVVTSSSEATSVSIQHAAELTLHTPEPTPTAPPPPPPSSSHAHAPAPAPAPSPTQATNNSPPHESAPESAPPPTQDSPTNDASSSDSSSSGLESDMLSDHNSFRAQHGASSMTWNNEMAGKAQQWANGCVFKHSGGTLGPFGENLAAGTGSSYSADTGFGQWTAEQSQYDPNNPVPSHFTQVVWKASVQLGCAVSECNDLLGAGTGVAKYLVCEYFPQGNVIGNFTQNVQL